MNKDEVFKYTLEPSRADGGIIKPLQDLCLFMLHPTLPKLSLDSRSQALPSKH